MKRLNFTYEPEHETKQEKMKKIPVKQLTDMAVLTENTSCFFLTQFDKDKAVNAFMVIQDNIIYYIDKENILTFAKTILEDEKIALYTSNSKELYVAGKTNGFIPKNIQMDIQLAAYLSNPESSNYDITRLVQEYDIPSYQIESANDFSDETLAFFSEISALPALCEALEKETAKNGQKELLHDIEIPLAQVLANMEIEGFALDTDGLQEFGKVLQKRIVEIQTEIYEAAGEEFNINSPKQLGDILFIKLELPGKKKTKTGFSTSAEVLENIKHTHTIVPLVLEYRTLAKLNSTYCEGLMKEVKPDGRIHSTLNQTETRTGRISSTDPNMQNIPVREELGRQLRRFFHARDGWLLVDADYSQIELRVLAHMADDKVMIEAFNQGLDIHATTASQVFHVPQDMVTPLMRSRSKAVNFGIVYGIGAFSLAKDIGVTRKEAQEYIDNYLNHYSGVRKYLEKAVQTAKEKGYVETLYGRRRYLPELTATNHNIRAFGERVAMNMPIQGTAADIIKIAMICVYERLEKEKMQTRLIMQVHDELILESPETEVEKAAQIVKEEMEHAAKLHVHLEADVHTGRTWYDAKE